MVFYLIRHGQSTYNVEQRIQGQSDVPLSPLGRRQADALAEALSAVRLDAVFSSPLQRAYQTAVPLARSQSLEIQTDPRLQEIHAGVFQGLLRADLHTAHPEHAQRWLDQEPDFVIPGGESRAALMVRGRAALEAIRRTRHSRVAVVSHGGLLGGALKSLLGIPAVENPFSLRNASITTVQWRRHFELVSADCIDHLPRDARAGDDCRAADEA